MLLLFQNTAADLSQAFLGASQTERPPGCGMESQTPELWWTASLSSALRGGRWDFISAPLVSLTLL